MLLKPVDIGSNARYTIKSCGIVATYRAGSQVLYNITYVSPVYIRAKLQ